MSVSLVLASYNSAQMLARSLPENLKAGFDEIIVVDGFSTDNTMSVIHQLKAQYGDMLKVYQIPKKGLGNAREYGNKMAKGDYIMHAGPDNIMPQYTVEAMLAACGKYDLVSCQTLLLDVNNYLDKAHNLYKKRYMSGVHAVVGTPYMAKAEIFKKFPYNPKMLNSDDTEFCQRLSDQGLSIYRNPEVCYEIGFNDIGSIIERWMRWGRGDALFFRHMQARWGIWRRIQSLCHPFNVEIVVPKKVLTVGEYIYVFPFLVMVMVLRYMGWLRYVIFNK